MVNAFKYSKQLEGAGVPRDQSEIHLQIITEIVESDLATKQDLEVLEKGLHQNSKLLETSLRHDGKALEARLHQGMNTLDTTIRQEIKLLETNVENKISNLEAKIQQLEYRITIKLGTLLIIGFTTMATLLKLWIIK